MATARRRAGGLRAAPQAATATTTLLPNSPALPTQPQLTAIISSSLSTPCYPFLIPLKPQQYAKPTDNGARGEVAARRGAKRDYNDSGDLEDSNYYLEQAGQKNLRLMLVQDEMERRKQKNGAGR